MARPAPAARRRMIPRQVVWPVRRHPRENCRVDSLLGRSRFVFHFMYSWWSVSHLSACLSMDLRGIRSCEADMPRLLLRLSRRLKTELRPLGPAKRYERMRNNQFPGSSRVFKLNKAQSQNCQLACCKTLANSHGAKPLPAQRAHSNQELGLRSTATTTAIERQGCACLRYSTEEISSGRASRLSEPQSKHRSYWSHRDSLSGRAKHRS